MKKALLILHGFAGNPKNHNKLIEYLGEDVEVFIFNMPGHLDGEVCRAKYIDWINRSEEELNKIISLGYDDITILGHSMGGVINTYLSSKYVEINRSIIMAPAFSVLNITDEIYRNRSKFKAAMVEYKRGKKIYNHDDNFALGFLKQYPLSSWMEFFKLVRKYYKYMNLLDKKALYLHGAFDFVASQENSKKAYEANNSNEKTYIRIENATHDIYLNENEYKLYELIYQFIMGRNFTHGYFNSLQDYIESDEDIFERIIQK